MFDRYIEVLAKCASQVFSKMTGKTVLSAKSTKVDALPGYFPLAIMIAYEHNGDRDLEGHFLLGFSNRNSALEIAAGVVGQFDLPRPETLNDTALDALGEFVNTVVGRTISLWDRMDMPVSFGPPSAMQEVEMEDIPGFNTSIFKIDLNLAVQTVSFLVTFTEPHQAQKPKAKILVAEDSKLIRGVLAKTLDENGYEVIQAVNGAEAVELFKQHRPDLCLMDLVMPEMGGLEAMMLIRELAPSARLVVLTSSQRRDEIVCARTIGISAYLLKPVQPSQLIATIRKSLANS